MKRFHSGMWALLLAGALLGACDDRKTVAHRGEPPPVVKVPPVETRPFEEGYAAGFVAGKTAGRPRAKLPEIEDVEVLASQEAGSDPQRASKWQRGWVSGYLDGFRQSSGHVK